jgi:hypothetical protein
MEAAIAAQEGVPELNNATAKIERRQSYVQRCSFIQVIEHFTNLWM